VTHHYQWSRLADERAQYGNARELRMLISVVGETLSDEDQAVVPSTGSYFEGSAPLSDGS